MKEKKLDSIYAYQLFFNVNASLSRSHIHTHTHTNAYMCVLESTTSANLLQTRKTLNKFKINKRTKKTDLLRTYEITGLRTEPIVRFVDKRAVPPLLSERREMSMRKSPKQ